MWPFTDYDAMSDVDLEKHALERRIAGGTPGGYDRPSVIQQLRQGDQRKIAFVALIVAIVTPLAGYLSCVADL